MQALIRHYQACRYLVKDFGTTSPRVRSPWLAATDPAEECRFIELVEVDEDVTDVIDMDEITYR